MQASTLRELPRQALVVLLTAAFGLALYLPFLSVDYDPNGITQAWAIEQGGPSLVHANHLLYRPIGSLVYRSAVALGYPGKALHVLQAATALFSALCAGVVFLVCYRRSGSLSASLASTLLLACSWAYWTYSTDVSYITLAALFAALALLALTVPTQSPFAALVAGFFAALAASTWQAAIFLVPLLPFIILGSPTPTGGFGKIRASIIAVVSSTVCIGVIYSVAWLALAASSRPDSPFQWVSSYQGGRLPNWGRWDLDRIPALLVSAAASWVPVWNGLGLRDLLAGHLNVDKLLNLFAAGGLATIIALALDRTVRLRASQDLAERPLWPLLGYLLFIPFIVWWDPFEPKWFILPNMFACVYLAITFGNGRASAWAHAIYSCSVLLIAASVFTSTIHPRSTIESLPAELASCFAQNTRREDALLAIDWKWGGYLGYFHGREVVSVIGTAARQRDRESILDQLESRMRRVHDVGGKVFTVDLRAVPTSHWTWFEQQTGLTRSDLEHFERQDAFECHGTLFATIMHPSHRG
jgi:hypothetical protein